MSVATSDFVLDPSESASVDVQAWGGKGAALARSVALGLPVPPFVVIPSHVADADVEAAAAQALVALGGPPFVAVRSSASDEDGAAHAFAGAFESFLFVAPERVAERVRDVRQSGAGERVRAYRAARGLDSEGRPPAVVIQQIVDAEAAGVAFSADPVTGEAIVVVSAVRGLGSALVDGRAEGETLRVALDGTVRQRAEGEQTVADRFDAAAGGGVAEVAVSETGPILSDADAARVAALAVRAAEAFGAPQDIEWAFASGTLWLLQSRPITTLGAGTLRLWDNANIVESYAGVTTPLTYSFARRAYAAVYREFCRILGVPEARIDAEAETFEQMIGLIHGRVYYNLGSWYRVLALLPGYRLNAGLMEGMMGVKEGIPDALRPEPPATGKLRDALALAGTVAGLVRAHVRLPRMRAAFLERVDDALRIGADPDALDLDQQADAYAALDARLLRQWDAPLVNDFFAMVWFGLANRAADAWIGPGALGGLLAGDGDVISAEPAHRVDAMARATMNDPALVDALMTESRADVEARLPVSLAADVAAYLDRFGDRCLEELKLESPTLTDDPTPLFRSVGARARRLAEGVDETAGGDRQRAEAEARASEALRGHPLRRLAFGVLLRNARARVRDRENLRFERTRVFGRARRLVLAMGARLVEGDRLDDARDVFSLEIGELLGLARGTATTADVRGPVAARQAEFSGYRAGPAPPDRFTTRGPVALSDLVPAGASPSADGDVRTGLGCCAGVVEGPVRVVRDPRGVELAPGTILVAERTDPGWVLLFPACAGLVVERGSLLSHSAIVARELGIPAAVSVPGATAWLRDGDLVRLDGMTGRVERLDA